MTIERITRIACAYFNEDYNIVVSSKKTAEVVRARHMSILVARAIYDFNYTQLGQHFGTDHATIRKAFLNQLDFIDMYEDYKTEVKLFLKHHKKMNGTFSIVRKKQLPEVFEFKLTDNELTQLSVMLHQCIYDLEHEGSSIEVIVLEEIKTGLEKKQLKSQSTYLIKTSRSQTATLYKWCNQVDFEHPLSTSLAIKLVGIIHKQITSL